MRLERRLFGGDIFRHTGSACVLPPSAPVAPTESYEERDIRYQGKRRLSNKTWGAQLISQPLSVFPANQTLGNERQHNSKHKPVLYRVGKTLI